jgi:endonuclease/exonuclease/phosphatase family metal-dependent hydrolase
LKLRARACNISHVLSHTATVDSIDRASVLQHTLAPHFQELARFNSTRELRASRLYAELRPEIERTLDGVVCEDFAGGRTSDAASYVRATAWNVERGKRLPGIVRALAEDADMSASDVLLLTELDHGMARTGNLFVAREIARALRLNYVFAPCYLALNKGSGLEARAVGENTLALHGNALFSRWPIERAHSFALPNGKDKMRGTEKRLGSQRAVVADVLHPLGPFRVASVHLDAHSTQAHRQRQMSLLLEHLARLSPQLPTLVGGDWNTTTYNSRRALYTIAGFFRRVAMGVGHFITTHDPHPDRWFERKLFREIERRGYTYRDLNAAGAGTLHYDVRDIAANTNMGDWIPGWCFWFLNRALAPHGGRCSLKLDWFAGQHIAPAGNRGPSVVCGQRDEEGPISDHDAIVLDSRPTSDS